MTGVMEAVDVMNQGYDSGAPCDSALNTDEFHSCVVEEETEEPASMPCTADLAEIDKGTVNVEDPEPDTHIVRKFGNEDLVYSNEEAPDLEEVPDDILHDTTSLVPPPLGITYNLPDAGLLFVKE